MWLWFALCAASCGARDAPGAGADGSALTDATEGGGAADAPVGDGARAGVDADLTTADVTDGADAGGADSSATDTEVTDSDVTDAGATDMGDGATGDARAGADGAGEDAWTQDVLAGDSASGDGSPSGDGAGLDGDDGLGDTLADATAQDAEPADGAALPVDAVGDSAQDAGGAIDTSTGPSQDAGGALDTTPPADTKVCPYGQVPKDLNCDFQGVCAGKVTLGCADEQPYCDYSAVLEREPTEFSCDGLDNDCNGATDDNLPHPPAKTWPAVGVCKKALMVCAGAAGWVEPQGWQIPQYEPQELSCDGLDNDCDGLTDSDIVAKPPLSTGKGVCGGLSMICVAGVWQSPPANTAPEWQPDESVCDGLDNDCDGLTDEALLPPGGVTVLQTGVCTGAKAVCQGGMWTAPDYHAFTASLPGAVTSSYQPQESSCDGLDNDCDGLTDEDLQGPLADNQQGACAGSRKVCAGDFGWANPKLDTVPGYVAGKETSCDTVDNDCDGLTDEDAACPVWQVGGTNRAGLVAVPGPGGQGHTLVFGAGSALVALDAATGALRWQDFAHSAPVLGVAASPDGQWIASVGKGAVLRVRPASGGPPTLALDAAGKRFTSVAWAPKGDRLALGDADGFVRFVSLPGAQGQFAKKGHSGPVRRLAWVGAGPWSGVRVVSGDDLGAVRGWQPDTGVGWVWTSPPGGKPGAVRAVTPTPDGKAAVVGWQQAGAALYDVDKGTLQGTLVLAGVGVAGAVFDSQARLWLVDTTGNLRRYASAQGKPYAFDWSVQAPKAPKGAGAPRGLLALSDTALWVSGDRATGTLSDKGLWTGRWSNTPGLPTALGGSGDAWALATAAGHLELHDWSGGAVTWTDTPHQGKAVRFVALHGGGAQTRLCSAGDDGATARYTWPAGAQPKSQASLTGAGPVAWHPDGSVLYRGVDAKVTGHTAAAQPTLVFQATLGKGDQADAVAPDGAGQRLAVASHGGATHLRVFSLATGATLWQATKLGASRHALAWRPDGKELLVSGGTAHLQLVSAASGAVVQPLHGHLGTVTSVGWSGDGQRLLSASTDGLVRLWRRTATGVTGLATLVRHCDWPCNGGVIGVRFRDPKGRHWVTVGVDGAAVGWSALLP